MIVLGKVCIRKLVLLYGFSGVGVTLLLRSWVNGIGEWTFSGCKNASDRVRGNRELIRQIQLEKDVPEVSDFVVDLSCARSFPHQILAEFAISETSPSACTDENTTATDGRLNGHGRLMKGRKSRRGRRNGGDHRHMNLVLSLQRVHEPLEVPLVRMDGMIVMTDGTTDEMAEGMTDGATEETIEEMTREIGTCGDGKKVIDPIDVQLMKICLPSSTVTESHLNRIHDQNLKLNPLTEALLLLQS